MHRAKPGATPFHAVTIIILGAAHVGNTPAPTKRGYSELASPRSSVLSRLAGRTVTATQNAADTTSESGPI